MNASKYMTEHWIREKVWRNLNNPKHKHRFRQIVSYLEGSLFLDVGCACGHSTNIMRSLHLGQWEGLDFSIEGILEAKKNFPDLDFSYAPSIRSVTCQLYDSVVCSEVIEHVEDDDEFLTHLWRLTDKVLVVTTPNKEINDPGYLRVYDKAMLETLFHNLPHEIELVGAFWYIISRRT